MRTGAEPIWPFHDRPIIWIVVPGVEGNRIEMGAGGIPLGGTKAFGWPVGLEVRPEVSTFGAPISAHPGTGAAAIGET